MRYCPSWSLGDEAQPLLPVEPVDLVDDAVDVIVHLGAAALDLGIMGEDIGNAFEAFQQRRHRHAPALDRLHHIILGIDGKRADLTPAVREESQRTRRSEESRVGKEGVSTCRSGRSPYH